MIRTVRRAPIPVIQPHPTTLSGLGCADSPAPCHDCGSSRKTGLGAITDVLTGLDWHVWLLVAAVAFIVVQNFFFSDAKKARRRKVREASEQYKRKLAQIRKGDE